MKVLFFDMWLKGVANFNRLMPEFANHPDVEVKMVHVGSWIEPQDAKVHEHEGFKSYDISYYNTWSLYRVLKAERPDVLVILNLYWLVDMALVQFCHKLGIRVVYLSHGRFSAPTAAVSTPASKKKKTLKERLNLENINKFRNYALSTLVTGKPWRFLATLYKNLTNPITKSLNSPYNPELNADKILLYYDSDREIMTRQRHFPDHNIFVTGNPELDTLASAEILPRDQFMASLGMPSSPYLLYLDDGFVQNGFFKSEDWMSHLQQINKIAQANGLKMVIKLHPRTPIDLFSDFFKSEGIEATSDSGLMKNLIHHSQVVTSLVSTTISYALLLGKRVVSPRWGLTADINRSYPDNIIHYSDTSDDFGSWIASDQPTCLDLAYVTANFGSLEGGAIKKIVSLILD